MDRHQTELLRYNFNVSLQKQVNELQMNHGMKVVSPRTGKVLESSLEIQKEMDKIWELFKYSRY